MDDEFWFGGAENSPDEEDGDESDQKEDEDAGEDSAEEFTAFVAVLAAVFWSRHGREWEVGAKMKAVRI